MIPEFNPGYSVFQVSSLIFYPRVWSMISSISNVGTDDDDTSDVSAEVEVSVYDDSDEILFVNGVLLNYLSGQSTKNQCLHERQ